MRGTKDRQGIHSVSTQIAKEHTLTLWVEEIDCGCAEGVRVTIPIRLENGHVLHQASKQQLSGAVMIIDWNQTSASVQQQYRACMVACKVGVHLVAASQIIITTQYST